MPSWPRFYQIKTTAKTLHFSYHILFQSDLWPPMPYIVFGVFATGAAVLELFLPETLNQKLSETVKEAKKLPR